MPQVAEERFVPVDPATAYAVSQTTGELRLRWDPFIRHQHLIDAEAPAVGVRTLTRARLGGPLVAPAMISRYVSYRPPTSVGMTMERGPWFFASFGGGWRFTPAEREGVDGTLASWKYTYAIRPRWLGPVAEPIGQRLLGREIGARIDAFARACRDPAIVAAATLAGLEFSATAMNDGDGAVLAQAMAAEGAAPGPPDAGFWIGYVAGTPVCCGGLSRLEDGAVEIVMVYVVPAWRGRGLTRRLLDFLEDRRRAGSVS